MASTARRIVVALLGCSALAHAQAIADLGYSTRASAGLKAEYAKKFGPQVSARIAAWASIAGELKAAGYSAKLEMAKGREHDVLEDVNDAINRRIRGIEDRTHWGVEDYWATPAESFSSAGGDCEDYSIAKYFLLKELGVPIERLRITYVRVLRNRGSAHMVLAYYAKPDAEPLILDNLDGSVRKASQRSDLEPVYGFNDDELQMARTGKSGTPAQIRAWLAMQERLVAESQI